MAVKRRHTWADVAWIASKKARKFYKGAKAVKTAYNVVKKNRSVSKPKTRKRTSSGKPSGKGTAGFGTFFRIVNKPPRKSPYNILKKIGNGCNYIYQETQSQICVAGVQNAKTWCDGNRNSDIQSAISNGASFYNNTSANIIQDVPTTGYRSNKFLLKNLNIKMEFTNQSPAIANMEIWICVSKVTKTVFSSPGTDWATLADTATGASTVTSNTLIGCRPTQSKQFNMNWKVKKVHKLQLMGGQCHTSTFDYDIKRYIDMNYFNEMAQIKGITVGILTIVWGQVADSTPSYTVGSISTTPVKIVGNTFKNYRYDMINAFPKHYANNGHVLAQEPLPSLYILNQEAGTISNVQDQTANTAYG